MSTRSKPLWTCPECGHAFVTRNAWHSCGRYELDAHFKGRDPVVREIFDALVTATHRCGPVTLYAQKTRIVFMVRVRFANVVTRKRWLYFSLWLTRPVEHPTLHSTESFGPTTHVHQFRLTDPSELDGKLESLTCESYLVGMQEHLS